MMRTLKLTACLLALSCMAGPIAQSAGDTPLEITFMGGNTLNPNASGRPSPVVVRIFQLTTGKSFTAAEYQGLFDKPAETLKKELLVVDEFVLRPGDSRDYARTLTPDVQVLGVAAAFRDIGSATWHVVVPIKHGKPVVLKVLLDQNTIQIGQG